jgi:hypothetical protein
MKRHLSRGIIGDQSGLDALEWVAVAGVITIILIFVLLFFF